MATVAQLQARINELELAMLTFPAVLTAGIKAALDEALMPLASEVVRAHDRINHAGDVFKELRVALTPKREPLRIARADFDAALAELRSDSGNDRASFPLDVIRARAHARAVLRRQTEAAGA